MNPFYSQCVASTASDHSTPVATTTSSSAPATKSSTSSAPVRTTTKSAALVSSTTPKSSSTAAAVLPVVQITSSFTSVVAATTKIATSSKISTSSKIAIAKSSSKVATSVTKASATTSSASSVGTSAASVGLLSSYTGAKAGDGTFYGTSDAGAACLLPTRTDQRFAAFPGAAWDNSEWCGGCIRVTGPDGSVDVQVTNECPECAEGSLDLATDAFAQISPTSAGRISITWDWIDCEAAGLTTGDVTFAWKSGSSAHWAGIQPRGGRVAVSSVSIKEDTATSYTALTRENYNYWVATSGAGAGPFTVLVDWQDGTSTTTSGVVLKSVIGDA